MILVYFLDYRIDTALFLLLAAGGWWLGRRVVRRRRPDAQPPSWRAGLAVLALAAIGALLAEWAGREQRDHLIAVFSRFGPTYAAELARAGHARINFATPADDPTYLALIEREKEWLRLNPLIADIYTFRRDPDGKVRFVVDSETDYNHDGKYEGEREQRTPIGEIYEETTPYFFDALDGKTVFDGIIVPDRWGVWVSSLCPIYDAQGKVEAALGIDYPAATWVKAIAVRRALVLVTALVVIAILLESSTLVTLMSAEIAERREAGRQLQQAKETADAASRAKSDFVAMISHEIRTPLSAVTGYASLLQDTPLDSQQERYLRVLQQGASNVINLVNDLLDFTKIEEGKLQLEAVPCRPAEIVGEVIDLLAAQAAEKNLALRFENRLADDLGVIGDPVRLRQILTNLVGNAVKFTAQGSVLIRACWRDDPARAGHGTLEISVADTGPGIPEAKMANLFQRFMQADASTARRHGGSGLGLAICRRLVQLMRGEISAKSSVGHGSEFTFSVPCPRASAALPPEPTGSVFPSLPSSAPGESAPSSQRHVLIVDDHPINRQVLQELLQRAGYTCEMAGSGREAVSLASRGSFAAILMDIEMPEMDGLAATRAIRAQEISDRRTPILAVTALTHGTMRASCRDAGMDDFVAKPVDRADLLTRLAAALSGVGASA
ncbi:MAG TPA: ATP-binding protein [Opitutaceae bacterium]|nr:ATP-binding protein [Opitutaceae bacterium]